MKKLILSLIAIISLTLGGCLSDPMAGERTDVKDAEKGTAMQNAKPTIEDQVPGEPTPAPTSPAGQETSAAKQLRNDQLPPIQMDNDPAGM